MEKQVKYENVKPGSPPQGSITLQKGLYAIKVMSIQYLHEAPKFYICHIMGCFASLMEALLCARHFTCLIHLIG